MSIWRTIISILQAFFGVQSTKNRDRDFAQGNPVVFLVTGLVITSLFLITLSLFVNYIVL